MLSKPALESSAGSRSVVSISSPSRSRTALPYSARLSRCRPTRPGLGCATAARSSSVSAQVMKLSRVGCIRPWHPGRRHHAAAQLLYDLLPQFGVRADVRGVDLFENEAAGLHALAVARRSIDPASRLAQRAYSGPKAAARRPGTQKVKRSRPGAISSSARATSRGGIPPAFGFYIKQISAARVPGQSKMRSNPRNQVVFTQTLTQLFESFRRWLSGTGVGGTEQTFSPVAY